MITKEQIASSIDASITKWPTPEDWAEEAEVNFDDLKEISHKMGLISRLHDGAMTADLWAMGFQAGFEVALRRGT